MEVFVRPIDLLVIGAVILVVWLVMKKPKAKDNQTQANIPVPKPTTFDAQTGWERLRSQPTNSNGIPGTSNAQAASESDNDFLRGAKVLYIRIQEARDRRNFDDVAVFIAPDILADLKAQANAKITDDKTEILLLQASLQDLRTEGTVTHASVHFEALQRQGSSDLGKEKVQSQWRFTRDESQPRALWTLIGIEDLGKVPVQ